MRARVRAERVHGRGREVGDAGRIIELLALVPEGGLPKELIDKAEAVGVFPKVEKATALFSQVTHGYGVISARGGRLERAPSTSSI